jgi:hypothetical protein
VRNRRKKEGRRSRVYKYLAAATTRRRLETPGRRRAPPEDAPSHRNAAHLMPLVPFGWVACSGDLGSNSTAAEQRGAAK